MPNGVRQLEAWHEPLAIGQPISTVPLWLDSALSIPLELEKTYLTACASLRIPKSAV